MELDSGSNRLSRNQFQYLIFCCKTILFGLMLGWLPNVDAVEPSATAQNEEREELFVSLLTFAEALESSLNQKQPEALDSYFNLPTFLRRVGLQIDDDDLRQRLVSLVQGQTDLFRALSAGSQEHYRFKQLRDTEREYRLQFRFISQAKHLEFFEFLVSRGNSGWQVVDWFQFSQGQLYSESLAQVYRLLLTPEEGLLARLKSLSPFHVSPAEKLLSFFQLAKQKSDEHAFAAYEALPESWQAHPTLMVLALNIANRSQDNTQYLRQMTRLAAHEDRLTKGSLLLLDYYFYRRNYDKALTIIDEASTAVGKDAQLLLLKANALRAKKELFKTEAAIKNAIRLEPSLTKSYFMLADCYLLMKRYQQALTLYQEIQDKLNYRFVAQHFAAFPEFNQREDVRRWLSQ